jgi:hypothetical protein
MQIEFRKDLGLPRCDLIVLRFSHNTVANIQGK